MSADASIPARLSIGTRCFTLTTSLDYISANIFDAGVDLLLDKRRRDLMYSMDSKCVLCGQSSCSSHSITAMCCNDFLVGFQSAVAVRLVADHLVLAREDLRSSRAITPCHDQDSFHPVPVAL